MPLDKVKMAYLILAHKNPEQVNLFIKQLLDYGDCDVYVHVDLKNKGMCDKILRDDRVFVCSEYETRWASFEIVKAAIKLMEMARSHGTHYTHVYFGSGQDLLVKKGLYEFLKKNKEKIFLRIIREVTKKDRAASRYLVRWPKKLMVRGDRHFYRYIRKCIQILCHLGIVIRRNKNELKNNVKFYTGGTWFIAPFCIVEYILDYLDENPDYICFWYDSLASDLMFFQTIIMNSPYANKIDRELMFVKWKENHPQTVQITDNMAIEAGGFYCARKFEMSEPQTIEFYIQKTMGDSTDA